MSAFVDRLKGLIGSDSVTAFSRKVEIGNTTIQNYLEGSLPRIDKAAQIAAKTGVSLEWLITGESERDSTAEKSQGALGTQPEQKGTPMLQIVDPAALEEGAFVLVPRMELRASAGTGLVPVSETVDGHLAFEAAYLRSLGINPRSARILPVSGDSMYPTLADQDQVIIDTSIDRVIDDALYAVVYGGAVLVKRVQLGLDGSVLLQSDNKKAGYRDQTVPRAELHDLHIVGRVKAHFRTL